MPLLETIASGAARAFGLTSFSKLIDSFFTRTTLLLTSNAANNSNNNTITDNSSDNVSVSKINNVSLGSFHPFLNNYSVFYDNTTSDGMYASSNANFAIGTGNFTVECWVFPQSKTDNSQRIMLQGQSGSTLLGIDFDSGVINIPINTSNKISYSWTSVELNKWHHLAVVRSGTGANQLKLYINGTEVASGTSSDSIGANNIHIGGINWASNYNFRGYISNFRYSNIARTIIVPTEKYVSDANTLLLINQTYRFKDESSNNNSITTYGTPSISPESPFKSDLQYSVSEGASYYFDGSGDAIQLGNNAVENPNFMSWLNTTGGSKIGTIEAWVYPIGLASDTTNYEHPSILNKGQVFFNLGVRGRTSGGGVFGTPRFYWYGAGNQRWIQSSTTIKLNEWSHIAVVGDGSTIKLYVNGVNSGGTRYTDDSLSETISAGQGGAFNGVNPGGFAQSTEFYIGRTAGAIGSTYWNGYVSNLRIVPETQVYTSNFTPPTAPLTSISGTKLLLTASETKVSDFSRGTNIEFVSNAVTSTAVVKNGLSSLRFPGDGSRIKLSPSDMLNFGEGDFTIEYWIYYTSLSGFQTPYTRGYTGGLLIQTGNGNGLTQVYAGAGSPVCAETSSPATNTWIHYAIVRYNGTITIYKNGTSVASGSNSNNVNFTGPAAFGANIFEGSSQADGGYPVNGYMDDIRVSRFARYTSNFTPPSYEIPVGK